MFFSVQILPFFLVVANLIWFFIWRKDFYLNKIVLLAWCVPSLWLILSNTLVFENDAYRYFVDGLHYLHDINPYAMAPENSPLAARFPEVFEKVGFQGLKTVYPPLAIWFFAGLVKLSQKNFEAFLWILKGVATTIGVLGSWAGNRSLSNSKGTVFQKALFFSLNPMLIFEWYINLHFDFLVAIGIALYALSSTYFRGLILGGTAALKYVFLVLLLFEFRQKHWYPSILRTTICVGLFSTTFLAFSHPLEPLMENLKVFGGLWEMNSGIFRLFRHIGYQAFKETSLGVSTAYALYYILVGVVLLVCLKMRRSRSEKIVWSLFLVVLLSPVCNPWYFTWAIFLLPRVSKRTQTVFFLSASALPLTYTFFLNVFKQGEVYLMFFNIEHSWIWGVFLGSLIYYKLYGHLPKICADSLLSKTTAVSSK